MIHSEYRPKSMGFDCKSTTGVRRFIVAPFCRLDFYVGLGASRRHVEGHVPAWPEVLGLWRGPTRKKRIPRTLALSPNIHRSRVRSDVLHLEAQHVATPQPVVDSRVNMAGLCVRPSIGSLLQVDPTRLGRNHGLWTDALFHVQRRGSVVGAASRLWSSSLSRRPPARAGSAKTVENTSTLWPGWSR